MYQLGLHDVHELIKGIILTDILIRYMILLGMIFLHFVVTEKNNENHDMTLRGAYQTRMCPYVRRKRFVGRGSISNNCPALVSTQKAS